MTRDDDVKLEVIEKYEVPEESRKEHFYHCLKDIFTPCLIAVGVISLVFCCVRRCCKFFLG